MTVERPTPDRLTVDDLETWCTRLVAHLDEVLADPDGDVDLELEAALDDFATELGAKVDALAWLRNRERAAAERLRADEVSLAKRRHRHERATERVTALLQRVVEAHESLTGEPRVKTDRATAFLRSSTSVDGPPSIDEWPDDLVVERVERRPDRAAAKKRLTAGEQIPGLSLHTRRTVQCRT